MTAVNFVERAPRLGDKIMFEGPEFPKHSQHQQKRDSETIKNSIKADKIPNAYLFTVYIAV